MCQWMARPVTGLQLMVHTSSLLASIRLYLDWHCQSRAWIEKRMRLHPPRRLPGPGCILSHCCGNTVTRIATAAKLTSWAVCYTASGCLWGKAHIAAVIVWLAWNVVGLWDDLQTANRLAVWLHVGCGCGYVAGVECGRFVQPAALQAIWLTKS